MSDGDDIAALASMSRRLGRDLLLTQGSGGNTSFKNRAGSMAVKLSGTRLDEVSMRSGWARTDAVHLRGTLRALVRLADQESAQRRYRDLLRPTPGGPAGALSIETGLHAVLPEPWVAHVHSIAGQLLGLMPEEESLALARAVLGSRVAMTRIAPAAPGFHLARDLIAAQDRAGVPSQEGRIRLWVLENHGLAWAASSPEAILAASAAFEAPLRERFSLKSYPPPVVTAMEEDSGGERWHQATLAGWPHCDFDERPLFPDFAGHFRTEAGPGNWVQADDRTARIRSRPGRPLEDHVQVFYAHALVSTLSRRQGCYRPLPEPIVKTIRDMDLETR